MQVSQGRELKLIYPTRGKDLLPRDVHAATSMLSYPAPLWQMYFREGGNLETSSASIGPVTLVDSLLLFRTRTSL